MPSFARYLTAVLVVLAFCALPRSAKGADVIWVGDSNSASCTETALQNALAYAALNGGRTIKFNCGQAPVTIPLTSTLTVPNNTTINGGGLITLSGPVIGYLLAVGHQSVAVLQNLTITNVAGDNRFVTTQGFGVLNEGTLTVKNANLSGSDGRAILNTGTLTVRDTAISDNGFFNHSICVGIYNDGVLTVSNSTFERNVSGSSTLCNLGVATVNNSTFSENYSDQIGGAIYTSGALTVSNSTFSRNSVAFFGGAISAVGVGSALIVNNSTFTGNGSSTDGGAIVGSGTINNSLFWGNSAHFIGGALSGQFVITNSVFSGNTSRAGGALFGGGTIANSSFTNNSAEFTGGAIHFRGSQLTIRNSSITGNSAGEAGGGIYVCCNADPILKNTVVTGNTPDNIAHE